MATHSKKNLARMLFATLLVLCVQACSRSEKQEVSKQSPSEALEHFPLLSHLPGDTTGFYVTRSHGKAFENYAKSPWVQLSAGQGGAQGALSNIPGLTERGLNQEALQALSGIARHKDSMRELLLYISAQPVEEGATAGDALPTFAMVGHCKTRAFCDAITGSLRAGEVSGAREVEDGLFALDIPVAAPTGEEASDATATIQSATVPAVFIKQHLDLFVASNNLEVMDRHLARSTGTSEYVIPQEVLRSVQLAQALDIGFLDVERFVRGIGAHDDEGAAFFPAHLLLTKSFDRATSHIIRARLTDETLSLPLFAKLSDGNSTRRLFGLTEGVILDFGISSPVMHEVSQLLPPDSGVPPGTGAMQFALLEGGAGSPFPALALAVQSSSPAALRTELKELFGGAIAGGGLPVDTTWREVEEGGRNISFIMSPLGVGLFLTETDNAVIASTSMAGIKSVVGGLGATRSEDDDNALVSVAMDFGELTKAIESVQASLAMFTGGESLLTPEQMANLRAMGRSSARVALKGNDLEFRSHY